MGKVCGFHKWHTKKIITLLNSQLIKKNNLHKQFFSHKLLTYEKLKYKEVSWQDSNLRPSPVCRTNPASENALAH